MDDYPKEKQRRHDEETDIVITYETSSSFSSSSSPPITSSPPSPPHKLLSSLPQLFQQTFSKFRLSHPTRIQQRAWPILLRHEHLMAVSPTGSGKTLAYVLPMIHTLSDNGRDGIVLVPTRELAIQISKVVANVVKRLTRKLQQRERDIRSVALFGGMDENDDFLQITTRKHPQSSTVVVCATPGKLLKQLSLVKQQLRPQFWVLDEADKLMQNDDLKRQVEQIWNAIRMEDMITCSFSASLGEDNRFVMRPRFVVKIDTTACSSKEDGLLRREDVTPLENAEGLETKKKEEEEKDASSTDHRRRRHDASSSSLLTRIPSHITQILHVCSQHKKPKKLLHTLHTIRTTKQRQRQQKLILVFFRQIKTLKYLATLLKKEGIPCTELHSHMPQERRTQTITNFRSGKVPLLLSTDVAARGIHIPNVEYVINYDFPTPLEQYVHRCGRTGRRHPQDATATASAATVYSFFHRELKPMANDVLMLLQSCNAWIDPNLVQLTKDDTGGNKPMQTQKRNKKRKRRSHKKHTNVVDNEMEVSTNKEEQEFAFLENKIVLQRAEYVSEVEESSDDDDDD